MVRGKERCILDELTQKILLEHFEDYEGQLKPADYELEVVKLENL